MDVNSLTGSQGSAFSGESSSAVIQRISNIKYGGVRVGGGFCGKLQDGVHIAEVLHTEDDGLGVALTLEAGDVEGCLVQRYVAGSGVTQVCAGEHIGLHIAVYHDTVWKTRPYFSSNT